MAVFPDAGGFGYAVFEGISNPVDWGTRYGKGNKNFQCLKKISALLTWYAPSVLVLENHRGTGAQRKSQRVRYLLRSIMVLARAKGIEVKQYSRAQIRGCFSELDAKTKDEIAEAIAKCLPIFARQVPRKRKLWMKEHNNIKLFDAISLIFTFIYLEGKRHAA